MHWIIYSRQSDGRLDGLRIVQSELRPHAPTINDGFTTPQDALDLLGEYLTVKDNGQVYLDEPKLSHHLTFMERVRHAYRVQPWLAWLVVFSIGLGLADGVLLLIHVF